MGKIVQLEEQLSNIIAAGEVVERPASVVKELVENAVDANSRLIEVKIEEAGIAKIRVIDDGDGIDEEDCLLAFQRHATSKIKDEHDLFRIKTLGFRGEALPSIASVSQLQIKTCTGAGAGTHIVLHGGDVVDQKSSSSRKGTEIIVENLFYNTPARLKYLKTIHTELGKITDVMNRIALANPSISFRLSHNGKQLLSTTGNGDPLQVIASIYGVAIAKKMVPIEIESFDFQVHGYLSLPEITRASRNYISTMINGRFIKNFSLVKAIQEGYHTLLPIGRYPIVFLDIKMDPLLVDVNVHPAKLEVRLSKEVELGKLIEQGVKDVFKHYRLIPEVSKPIVHEKEKNNQQELLFEHQPLQESEPVVVKEEQGSNHFQNHSYEAKPLIKEEQEKPPVFVSSTVNQKSDEGIDETFEEIGDLLSTKESRIPPLYPIGQLHSTYILAENDNGLYIIDQHAAQERIKYEYFREKVGQVSIDNQEMLIPLTFHYSKDQCFIIEENKFELEKVGVYLESFGHNSYIVRSHPQWFPKGEEASIIEEMIEQVFEHKKVDIKRLREEAAIMMSCKASIKANQHLRNEEMFALLETLRKTMDPFTCPHGRPIIIHYSKYEMEKMFKRVM